MSETVLERWASILLDAMTTEEPGATLVRLVVDDKGEHELGLQAIDCHPVEALAALDSPVPCFALGVATGGRAAPRGATTHPSAHPDAQRIFQVVLVERSSAVAGRVRFPDGSVLTEPPGGGAVLDALRTALGLPVAA